MGRNDLYKAYKQQSVMSMTPGEMLTTLYDAALKNLELAKIAFDKNNISQINKSLQKVQEIFHYMKNTLDFKYEISQNLGALYDFFIETALQANMKKDPSKLDDLISLITDLRDTYKDADKKVRTNNV